MAPTVGLPSWDYCVFNSLDTCGQAYLGAATLLIVLLVGLWTVRGLMLDVLSDVWPRIQAQLPRAWRVPAGGMPAVLVAGQMRRPVQVGRLWYGATLAGSDPPAPDAESAAAALQAIAKHDGSFSTETILDLARRAALVVLRAWTDQDPRLSRRLMAPLIWEQQQEDLAAYRADGRRNVLEGLTVRAESIVGAASDGHGDTVVVRISVRAADYDILAVSGAIVRGSRTPLAWTEDWVFQRPLPRRQAAKSASHCPQCGASLDLDVDSVCAKCSAELHNPAPEWILSRIDVVPEERRAKAA